MIFDLELILTADIRRQFCLSYNKRLVNLQSGKFRTGYPILSGNHVALSYESIFLQWVTTRSKT